MNSFSDLRVFPKLAKFPYPQDRITATQDDDGPTFLHVGSTASDKACSQVAEKYHLEIDVLKKVRAEV